MTTQTPPSNIQGVGLGLRACHYPYLLEHLPPIPWLEALTENYMVSGGMVLERLMQIRAHYPIVFHGVGLSVGGTAPLSKTYLSQLKHLIDRFEPAYVSDHLCWTSIQSSETMGASSIRPGERYARHLHELLPLPYTEEAVQHAAARIRQVQDFLGQQLLIENVSSYLTYTDSTMSEWEFLNAVAEQADCFILLDINNIYVSGYNHGFDPYQYLASVNKHRIKQYHLAGFLDCGTHLIDTHGTYISEPVWRLYEAALTQIGHLPVCIEWDNEIPECTVLLEEMAKIKNKQAHTENQICLN